MAKQVTEIIKNSENLKKQGKKTIKKMYVNYATSYIDKKELTETEKANNNNLQKQWEDKFTTRKNNPRGTKNVYCGISFCILGIICLILGSVFCALKNNDLSVAGGVSIGTGLLVLIAGLFQTIGGWNDCCIELIDEIAPELKIIKPLAVAFSLTSDTKTEDKTEESKAEIEKSETSGTVNETVKTEKLSETTDTTETESNTFENN